MIDERELWNDLEKLRRRSEHTEQIARFAFAFVFGIIAKDASPDFLGAQGHDAYEIGVLVFMATYGIYAYWFHKLG